MNGGLDAVDAPSLDAGKKRTLQKQDIGELL